MQAFTEFSQVEAILIAFALIGVSILIAKLARSNKNEE